MRDLAVYQSVTVDNLPSDIFFRLCGILDLPDNGWRELCKYIPDMTDETANVLAIQCMWRRESPSKQLLRQLGPGRYGTVQHLIGFLQQMHHEEALLLLIPPENVKITSGLPENLSVAAGGTLTLCCEATGLPHPQYRWYTAKCNNLNPNELVKLNCTDNQLRISQISQGHEGFYICRVHNNIPSHAFSNYCKVKVIQYSPGSTSRLTSVTDNTAYPLAKLLPNVEPKVTQLEQPKLYTATNKVALLIGNKSYDRNVGVLANPSDDVITLARHLQRLGFMVLSLVDLNLDEMQNAVLTFCKMLSEGAYGLFYFAGHGFELNGVSFMVPVNAKQLKHENCLPVPFVWEQMHKRRSVLNILVLDMCRGDLPESDSASVIKKMTRKNATDLVVYTTLGDAYGLVDKPNGFYMKYWDRVIDQKVSVGEMFRQINEDIGTDECLVNLQRPEIQDAGRESNRRSLHDRIVCESDESIDDISCQLWNSMHNIAWSVDGRVFHSDGNEFVSSKNGFEIKYRLEFLKPFKAFFVSNQLVAKVTVLSGSTFNSSEYMLFAKVPDEFTEDKVFLDKVDFNYKEQSSSEHNYSTNLQERSSVLTNIYGSQRLHHPFYLEIVLEHRIQHTTDVIQRIDVVVPAFVDKHLVSSNSQCKTEAVEDFDTSYFDSEQFSSENFVSGKPSEDYDASSYIGKSEDWKSFAFTAVSEELDKTITSVPVRLPQNLPLPTHHLDACMGLRKDVCCLTTYHNIRDFPIDWDFRRLVIIKR